MSEVLQSNCARMSRKASSSMIEKAESESLGETMRGRRIVTTRSDSHLLQLKERFNVHVEELDFIVKCVRSDLR